MNCHIWLMMFVRFLHDAFACSEHPQTRFCAAEFALKATIRKQQSTVVAIDGTNYHACRMSIKTQIRVDAAFMSLPDTALRTVHVRDTVFSNMSNDSKKFLITGKLHRHNNETVLIVDECDWVQQWADLSHRHKSALRKRKFESSCTCQIFLREEPAEHRTFRHCRPPSNLGNAIDVNSTIECYATHSFCAYREPRYRCAWALSDELRRCLENSQSEQ